ncbi:MAG: alpha/beta hydrolase [Gammaproteobacteria bacterium]
MTNNLYFENISSDANPKGVFIISHGMAEHIGRYEWLITNLNNDGYHVISRDHRGHGVNISDDNIQGFFSDKNGWLKVRDDLESTIHYAKKKYPNLNCFLFGHSMGSWVALSVLNKKLSLNAIVLSGSSMLPKAVIMLNLIIIKVDILINGKTSISNIMDRLTMRRFNAKYKPFRTPNDWISSDIESVDAYTSDGKCGFPVTSGLWLDLCKGMLMIFKKNYYLSANYDIPVLIISGDSDAASSNGKLAKKLYKFLSKIFTNVTINIVKNSRHEVFTEVNKLSSYNYLIKYIKQF